MSAAAAATTHFRPNKRSIIQRVFDFLFRARCVFKGNASSKHRSLSICRWLLLQWSVDVHIHTILDSTTRCVREFREETAANTICKGGVRTPHVYVCFGRTRALSDVYRE